MSENTTDPSGNTDQFRAFVQRPEAPPAPSRKPLYIGGGVALALIILVVIIVLLVV